MRASILDVVAQHGPAVVARLAEAAGHPVRVLPGHEEARLSYRGARAAVGDGPGGLAVLDLPGRADIPGVQQRRADRLHIATIVLVDVLEHLGVERLEVCDWGLREGVLLAAARA